MLSVIVLSASLVYTNNEKCKIEMTKIEHNRYEVSLTPFKVFDNLTGEFYILEGQDSPFKYKIEKYKLPK